MGFFLVLFVVKNFFLVHFPSNLYITAPLSPESGSEAVFAKTRVSAGAFSDIVTRPRVEPKLGALSFTSRIETAT